MWRMQHSILRVATPPCHRIFTHTPSVLNLPKSEFWFCCYALLRRHFHRTVQAHSRTPPDGYTALSSHLAHHAICALVSSDTSTTQSLPFPIIPTPDSSKSTSFLPTDGWPNSYNCDPSRIPILPTNMTLSPTVVPRVDHLATVNASEAYGVPVGVVSPMNQPTAISSDPILFTTPIVIEKTRWYSEYGIERGANGSFYCPYAGCRRKTKRRDQLWEHWKAKHNNDPYSCGLWFVL